MRSLGSLFSILLFIALMIEIIIFSPKETGTTDPSPAAQTKREASEANEQWIEGVHLTETSEGKKEWELKAARAVSVKEKGTWVLKEVQAKFFGGKSEEDFFEVLGDEGQVVAASKDMSVKGHVIVKSHNGYEFRTESVNYSSEKKRLTTNDPIEMSGQPDTDGEAMDLKGTGLSTSVDEQTMDILKDVRLERKLKDGRQVVIRSESARFYSQSRAGEFKGKVIVDIGASRISGPFARFIYDSSKKALSSMEVEGGVNMTDVDKWATAQKVEMSFLDDEFVLKGSPKMMQNTEELTGQEIRFSEGGRKVQVKGGRAVFDSTVLENGDQKKNPKN